MCVATESKNQHKIPVWFEIKQGVAEGSIIRSLFLDIFINDNLKVSAICR